MYIAGPPCQPFSTAGKRKGWSDGRAKIMSKSGDYIIAKRPKVWLLENVPAWRKQKRFRAGYLGLKKRLEKAGYKIFTQDLRTNEHGLPQARVRTYMVGFKRSLKVKKFQFPSPLPWGHLHPMDCLVDAPEMDTANQSATFQRNLRTVISIIVEKYVVSCNHLL